MENTRSNRSEDLFFRYHLILGTKINKNGLKVPQFLMGFKNVPQTEKGSKTLVYAIIQ